MSVIAAANWDEWVAKAAAYCAQPDRDGRLPLYRSGNQPTANPPTCTSSCGIRASSLAYRWFDLALARDCALVAAQLRTGRTRG